MDIYTFAMEIEKISEQYYRDLAQQCDHPGLVQILNMLAEDEAKHYQTIQGMRDGKHPEMPTTQVLRQARERFAGLKKEAVGDLCFNNDEITLYRKAIEKEDHAEKFYREKADEAEEPLDAALFSRLADEENRHRFLLENIIEFLSRPKTWVENAEFNHLDEY